MKTSKNLLEEFRSLDGKAQEAILSQLQHEFERGSQIFENSKKELSEIKSHKPCPHCKSENVWKRGTQNSVQMFKCKDCLKWYNENTGSPMYNIKKKHLWQEYLRHMQAGLSIKRIAKVMPISIQTSFDWRHKILSALASKAPLKLGKIVECDEMEIALSNKGEHGLKRKARKRGTDFKRNTADKRVTTVQVVTAVDREGNKYLKAVETKRLSSSQINKAIGKKITKGTLLITDEHPSYKGFVKTKSSIVHKPINAKLLKKSTDKKINLQRVNNTHKQLDDFLDRFNGVSSKYLQNYLNWFTCQKEFNQMANKVKTWCLAILTSTQAYDLFYEFKANAVNIRT